MQFPFAVNESFRHYPSHPITVPRGLVDYRALEAALGPAREGTMHFPDGSTTDVFLYHGNAGHGEYYQIRSRGRAGWPSRIAQLGRQVDVVIERHGVAVDVQLNAR